jgi:hypothetical protein
MSSLAGPTADVNETPARWGLRVGGMVVAFGIVLNVVGGIVFVVFVWFLPALVNYAAKPQYLDPLSLLLIWCNSVPMMGALVGGLAGLIAAVPIVALGRSRLPVSLWLLGLVPLISAAIVVIYMAAIGQYS